MNPNDLSSLNQLAGLGLTLPSPAYLFGLIFFGVAGMAAYAYGKKTQRPRVRWLGVALMLYPYLVNETWQLYALGCALCAAMWVFRD
jgi:hypothetical protein